MVANNVQHLINDFVRFLTLGTALTSRRRRVTTRRLQQTMHWLNDTLPVARANTVPAAAAASKIITQTQI